MNYSKTPLSWQGLLHLFVVYIVWGSTYLAIRIAVQEGSGFPPFLMAASRALFAGPILVICAGVLGHRLKPSREELKILAMSGLLLWTGGNGLVVWASQWADSGYAALVIGSTPIWVAVMESVLDRRIPTVMLTTSLIVGLSGIVALTAPVLSAGTAVDIWNVGALLLATISWGAGSILLGRRPVKLQPILVSGYQQIFGALGFLFFALVNAEPLPTPSLAAWLAWGYLVIFGSFLAFTSYIIALKTLPINIVTTYAYVNPVIAVILGHLVLNEALTPWVIFGTFLVLLGVAGVFYDRRTKSQSADNTASVG